MSIKLSFKITVLLVKTRERKYTQNTQDHFRNDINDTYDIYTV